MQSCAVPHGSEGARSSGEGRVGVSAREAWSRDRAADGNRAANGFRCRGIFLYWRDVVRDDERRQSPASSGVAGGGELKRLELDCAAGACWSVAWRVCTEGHRSRRVSWVGRAVDDVACWLVDREGSIYGGCIGMAKAVWRRAVGGRQVRWRRTSNGDGRGHDVDMVLLRLVLQRGDEVPPV